MIIEYYPRDYLSSRVHRFLHKELKERPDLRLLTEEFVEKVKESDSLSVFVKIGWIKPLGLVPCDSGKSKTRLYEIRVPPERRGGVVRIFFIINKSDPQRILLLDAEIKHGTASRRQRFVESMVWGVAY